MVRNDWIENSVQLIQAKKRLKDYFYKCVLMEYTVTVDFFFKIWLN